MEIKHTPGPWSFEGPDHSIIVYGPEPEQRICFMTSDGPATANALLIAAAPELLAALKAQLAYEAAPTGTGRLSWMELVKVRDAAIAKAEGRS